MSSDKRSFDNFNSFAGNINKTTEVYEFPKLYTTDKSGNKREWSIYVRLIKKSSKKSFKIVNWALTSEDQVPIKIKYLNDDEYIPDGIISQVWTESGITNGEITRSAPTYPKEKNINRSNYRDCFKQALIFARGKYLKKIDEGGVVLSEYGKNKIIMHEMYFPMLAKKYDDYILNHKLTWPIYVQPKLDGIRCIAYINPKNKSLKEVTYKNVIMYTRNKKEYPNNKINDNIRKELLPYLLKMYETYKNNESVYLDGELYNHTMKLQNINHYVRTDNLESSDDEKSIIQYWIYDAFYPSQELKFEDRKKILDNLEKKINKNRIIKIIETLLIDNQNSLDKQYKKYINDNYEGMMIRLANGLYMTNAKGKTGLRSNNLLKRKEVFTEEYEVVDWTDGKAGKEIGAIIWICQTNDGKKFNVTPNLSYEERYKIYKECQKDFKNKYANRMLMVEFRGLSEDNKPQHAKGILFRDIE